MEVVDLFQPFEILAGLGVLKTTGIFKGLFHEIRLSISVMVPLNADLKSVRFKEVQLLIDEVHPPCGAELDRALRPRQRRESAGAMPCIAADHESAVELLDQIAGLVALCVRLEEATEVLP